jgi:two-component system, NtrC family, sensor kinase
MKIARKFTLALVACVIVALSISAIWTVREEMARAEQEAAAHQIVIGRALRPAITSVWSVDGRDRALALLREADQRLRRVQIRWVLPDSSDEAYAPLVKGPRLEPLARGEDVTVVERETDRVVSYVPLNATGALEISESLERARDVKRAAIRQAGLLALGATLLAALAASLLGAWFVGRPMATFLEQVRRIGSGDLSYRIPITQRDEFGVLAEEMNRMCDRLAESSAEVAQANEANMRALDQLRHADRLATVGRLAAGMAHELGTPLNVVSARAKPIWTGKVSGDAAKENARIVVEQVDRMAKIMRQLLDFARKRALSKVTADLVSGVRRIASILEPMARKGGVEIVVEGPTDAVEAKVDPGQMDQVVTNLVINAIQASPRGEKVTVRVSREQASSAVDGHPDPVPCVVVRVLDRGAGISPDHLAQVFEPFFTTREIGEGTGLGLSVAYGIVKDHGGWIHVDSTPGAGSTFSVNIPEDRA